MHIFRLMLRCIIISIMCNIEVGNLEQLLKQNERMFSAARLIRRYSIVLTLMVALFAFMAPQPEAKAMDPVTIAILAPIAIQVGKAMMPYIEKQLSLYGSKGLKMHGITRHMLGLMTGLPGARRFRQILSDPAKLASGNPAVLLEALAAVRF